MFTDNLGKLVAGLFRPPSTGAKTVTGLLRRDTGGSFNTTVYNTQTNTTYAWTNPNQNVQVGKGTTPPTRQDYNVEQAFASAPEANPFPNLGKGYNSGLGKIEVGATLSNVTDNDSVSEYVKIVTIRDSVGGATTRECIWVRDTFTPQAFLAGENIVTNLEVLI